MKNAIQQVKMIALGILVAVGATYAFAWTGPTGTPPNGNVAAPINVSTSTQTKYGNLVLNGLSVNAASILSGVLQIPIGTPAAGDVLTSADASGTVEWAPLPTSSSKISYLESGITFSPDMNVPTTITFSTPMPDTNYAVAMNFLIPSANVPGRTGFNAIVISQTASGFTYEVTGAFNNEYNIGATQIEWVAAEQQSSPADGIIAGVIAATSSNTGTVTFPFPMSNANYVVNTNFFIPPGGVPSQTGFNAIVTSQTTSGFSYEETEAFDGEYNSNQTEIPWIASEYQPTSSTGAMAGLIPTSSSDTGTVTFSSPMPSANYAVVTNLMIPTNDVPGRTGCNVIVTNQTTSGFTYDLTEAFNGQCSPSNTQIPWMAVPFQ